MCRSSTKLGRSWQVASARFSISRPIWEGWGSSRTTRPLACCRCSRARTCSWPPKKQVSSASSIHHQRVCTPRTSRPSDVVAPRVRRLPGDARRWLRVGEALQRADGSALQRGLWGRDQDRSLSQRLRAARDMRRRPREGSRRGICRRWRPRAHWWPRHRDLGGRRADSQFHVHRRLHRGHPDADTQSDFTDPINLGSNDLVTINQLYSIVEDIAGVRLNRHSRPPRPQGRPWPEQ